MDTYDIVLTALAVVAYAAIGYKTIRWVRSKPRDWRYAALVVAKWASWFIGATLAYNWPTGAARIWSTAGLLICFETYAATMKAAERRAQGWKIVGVYGNSIVSARVPDDQFEKLRQGLENMR